MPAFRDHFISCCGYELHVRTWGSSEKPALVMSHGLARLADDFDHVAPQFSDDYFVLCPSMIGRGLSGWAKDPDQEYTVPFYVAQTFEMLDHFKISNCKWIGTSMGGLIGLAVTAEAAGWIEKLVLNDIGPELDPAAVARIKSYVGASPEFETISDVEQIVKLIYAPFGIVDEASWAFISARSVRRLPNGNFMMHYDPEVMRVFAEHIDKFDAWDQFNALACPVMLISGAKSDLIPPSIVEKMKVQKPEMPVLTVANCGHAPHLNDREQIKAIKAFLSD
ncbi:alpha/beta fold hydrolase [Thalassospira alkalitolerans]|uniref:Hydrolase n=1 Tax=Thalassospira alkalitolerans TaxID=1293890 RepID=A0A1Y2L9H6_9PROT|nr:alpha/beta hydrolase [Thalassospira alkalitolerans]OSQ47110.1 hydrolase [Thalassospira alkalitolerans]|tara:strand:+ start:64611 stop:65447 length:837 start_codon:yes stop_codon:yes gene_type:complete